MPAAAVTPAPEAYIKVVAVKKLVVGSGSHGYMPFLVFGPVSIGRIWVGVGCAAFLPCLFRQVLTVLVGLSCQSVDMLPYAFNRVSGADGTFTLNKFECSKQAYVPENSCME